MGRSVCVYACVKVVDGVCLRGRGGVRDVEGAL